MAEVILGKPKIKSSKRQGIRDWVKKLSPTQRKDAIKALKKRKVIREMKEYKKARGRKGGFA